MTCNYIALYGITLSARRYTQNTIHYHPFSKKNFGIVSAVSDYFRYFFQTELSISFDQRFLRVAGITGSQPNHTPQSVLW